MVHHERHHWRVRLDRLLDVGLQRVLQHPGQSNHRLHRVFHHAICCRVVLWAVFQLHFWSSSSWSLLQTMCHWPNNAMSSTGVSRVPGSAHFKLANTMFGLVSTITSAGDSLAAMSPPMKQESALNTCRVLTECFFFSFLRCLLLPLPLILSWHPS